MSPGEETREFYRQQGRQQERDRIIKLLEANSEEPCCCYTGTFGDHEGRDLIALIKGEQK